ncbi:hypothetical protein [Pyrinomonas sp.]|uniref:hypothetical protein n=1 Tax=Pyrinomonas sp. TaxID=2080306 RepID=UPI00331D743E
MRCPYCERPLHRLGTHCRACRRNIWRWPHLFALAGLLFLALLLAWGLLIAP